MQIRDEKSKSLNEKISDYFAERISFKLKLLD